MVGFNSVQNSGKWLDFSVKNNLETLPFATREFPILFSLKSWSQSNVNFLVFLLSLSCTCLLPLYKTEKVFARFYFYSYYWMSLWFNIQIYYYDPLIFLERWRPSDQWRPVRSATWCFSGSWLKENDWKDNDFPGSPIFRGQKWMTQRIPLILETILQRFLRNRNITHIDEIISTDFIFLSHATALTLPAMVSLKSSLVIKNTASHLPLGGSPSGLSQWWWHTSSTTSVISWRPTAPSTTTSWT